MTMEGLWSNKTHPKDFPSSVWLRHFSDVIGASHGSKFTFWGRGQTATDGFLQLAEGGSTAALEGELRASGKYLRTLIRAPGLWHPYLNSNTSAYFRYIKH